MAAYKTEQRYLQYRGTECHFVSYEGQAANIKKSLPSSPPTWYLMQAGKRWAVMEQIPGQLPEETDRLLLDWLDAQDFPIPVAVPVHVRRAGSVRR